MPSGSRLLDIGTDHALLPIYLLQQGRISTAIAGDRSRLPLQQAQKRKNQSNISDDQLQLIHSNGFQQLVVQRGDVAVLAGMGGRMMQEILSSPKVRNLSALILQPNRNVFELRSFLQHNNWLITNEKMILENDQFYPTLFVEEGTRVLSLREAYFGPVFLMNRPPEWIQWIQKQHAILQTIQERTGERMPIEKRKHWLWTKEILNC